MLRIIGAICCVLLAFLPLSAQQIGYPYIRNYTPREFKASSANYAIVQDGRGVMYFGNYRGVLEYDGANWRLIPVINRSTVRALARDSVGHVYVGASGDFGHLVADSTGMLQYQSMVGLLPEVERIFYGPVRVLGTRKGACFHVLETNRLYVWDEKTLSSFDLSEAAPRSVPHLLDGRLFFSTRDQGLLEWKEEKIQPVSGGELLKNHTLVAATQVGEHSYLVRAFQQGFFHLKFSDSTVSFTPWETELDENMGNVVFSAMTSLHNGHLLVGTFKQGAYELDANGRILRTFIEESGLQDDIVLGAFEDRAKNLWLALSQGISRVEVASPLSRFGEKNGLEGIVFATLRHKQKLYAATPMGVFFLEGNRFSPVQGVREESWQLHQVVRKTANGQEETHLFANSVRGLYEIRNGRGKLLFPGDFYQDVASAPGKDGFYALSTDLGVHEISYEKGRWKRTPLEDSTSTTYGQLVIRNAHEVWLVEMARRPSRVIRMHRPHADAPHQRRIFGEEQGLPPVQRIFPLVDKVVFSTIQGLYAFDPQTETFYPDTLLTQSLGVPEAEINYLLEDPQGNMWAERFLEHRRWVDLLTLTDEGNFIRDSLLLTALADVEIWGRVYPESDGKVWLGTPEGLFCYDSKYERPQRSIPLPIIRQVSLSNDSLLYGGTTLAGDPIRSVAQLSHGENSLTFHYVAPFFDQQESVHFRARLIGRDTLWSIWDQERKKDYTLLPPGPYEFQVQSRNAFYELSEVATYKFEIRPPWYRTTWAFICYGVLTIFLIYATVKLNTHRLHLKNEHLERVVYERTTEIWAQHKEIVKKTVALKRQKEEVASQRNLLETRNHELGEALDRLKAAQSKLVESEKMASLGQLTAGIAHEINNPINYVKNNVGPLKRDFTEIRELFFRIQSLKNDVPDLEERVSSVRDYAKEIDAVYLFEEMELLLKGIEEGAIRTKDIVDGLKTFSRTERDTFKLVDIHAGIESTLTLLNSQIKGKVEVHKDFGDMPVVECLPGKLNQVFMNILSNGVQAILDKPEGESSVKGNISIRTYLQKGCLGGEKDCVCIEIEDDGVGIKGADRSHIFEPFFTTKEVGQGTGLGLAISFGIIEQHQGRIDVLSELDKGSRFTLILPLRQEVVKEEE